MNTINRLPTRALRLLLGAACIPALVACGGGGGGSSRAPAPAPTPVATPTPTPTPPVSTTPPVPTWVQGEFPPSSSLKDLCETPRTGNDPNGNPRPDEQGELGHELFWLRSFSDEIYLYFDEIVDQNPNLFDNRITYFDELITRRVTATGRPVDRFHFTEDTESRERRVSGQAFGYGASFEVLRGAPPRNVVVSFAQQGSPAEAAGLVRGARILTVDDADVVNGGDIDTFVNGLFPSAANETHVFEVEQSDGTRETITLQSADIAVDAVQRVGTFQRGDTTFGYINFDTFGSRNAEAELVDAFNQLRAAGVDELVMDLRYNRGGFVVLSAQLAYMVAGDIQSNGRVFERLEFNSKSNGRNPVTGEVEQPFPFVDETIGLSPGLPAGQDLPSLDLPRVFVLTTDATCSASEGFMNGLMGIDVEVIQIGSRTCGKNTGQIPTDNCGITYNTTLFRGVNDKGFGEFADGFAPGEMTGSSGPVVPGCEAEDDFSNPLGNQSEGMLSAAITYAETGSCPVQPAVAAKQTAPLAQSFAADPGEDLMNDPRMVARERSLRSAIMERP